MQLRANLKFPICPSKRSQRFGLPPEGCLKGMARSDAHKNKARPDNSIAARQPCTARICYPEHGDRRPKLTCRFNGMNAQQAFAKFVNKVLTRQKAERFIALSGSAKGQQKILDGLNHSFGAHIRPTAVQTGGYDSLWEKPCYVFYGPLGFGKELATVRDAHEKLSVKDGWLILLIDASKGIHRPEARWDDEKLIVG
jgi:hypothetical protein